MHFSSILAIDLPKVQPDLQWEKEVEDSISKAMSLYPDPKHISPIMAIELSRLNCLRTSFGRAVDEKVRSLLEKFDYNTTDPAYLEFVDRTDEVVSSYSEAVNCIILPDGKIVEEDSYIPN